jgi:kumamolisin
MPKNPAIHPYFKRRSNIHSYLKRARADNKRHHPTTPPPVTTVWTVPSLAHAYGCPANAPGGGVIGIVELGGGWNKSDVQQAFEAMNLPQPNITDISVDGTENRPGGQADGEVALDIQVAGGFYAYCTGRPAKINVYWSQDIATGITRATSDGCDVISISWGASEPNWSATELDATEAAAEAAVKAGTIVFAASGDNSADDGGGSTAVDAPASCPHIIGCGGTSKPQSGPEMVWGVANQPDGSGTGGGFSARFPVQPWQLHCPPPPTGLGRMVPDVAGNADPNSGWDVVLDGQVQVFGGTSAVAPMWAGLLAACGTKLGWITPALYQNQDCFETKIPGSNGVYTEPPNPGPCTGIGVPVGTAIVSLFETPAAVA